MLVKTIDDRLLHYLIFFGGMVIMSALHKLADILGWDIVKALKKLFVKKA
jgi:hypothetical protein